MSHTMATLAEEALNLSEPERGELARLIDSLEPLAEDDDTDIAANWGEEIRGGLPTSIRAEPRQYLGPSQDG